jgi:hypothetical protein
MTKWILAITMTLGAFAATTSSSSATPTVDDSLDVGTCSYTCSSNGVTYLNRTQCRASCSGSCVIEAC